MVLDWVLVPPLQGAVQGVESVHSLYWQGGHWEMSVLATGTVCVVGPQSPNPLSTAVRVWAWVAVLHPVMLGSPLGVHAP